MCASVGQISVLQFIIFVFCCDFSLLKDLGKLASLSVNCLPQTTNLLAATRDYSHLHNLRFVVHGAHVFRLTDIRFLHVKVKVVQ